MRYTNLGQFSKTKDYIKYKLGLLDKEEHSFSYLYKLMFSEEKNIMFEKSEGYRIKKLTYLEVKNNIEIKAYNLSSILKNKKGLTIGIYLDNDNRFIETYWAVIRSGNNPLLMNTRLSDAMLNEALKITEAELVISNGKNFDVKTINVAELEADNGRLIDDKYGDKMFIMSTGTSSKVKICAYEANQLFAVLKQSDKIILKNKKMERHYQGELKLLAFLPFYHIFGFIAIYLWFSFYSRTFVLLNDFSPKTIQNTIKRHHITHIFAVPLLWKKTYQAVIKEIKNKGEKTYQKFLKGMRLMDKPLVGKLVTKYGFKEIRDNLFGDSISYMITGGSMISNDVIKFFNAIGYPMSNGYGMSEVGITSFELSSKKKYIGSGSIGEPLPGVSYEIQNDELIIRGDTLATYVIEEGKKIKLNNEYHSKDLAYQINGHYYLKGREDDLLIASNGENINPYEVEKLFNLDTINETCLIYDSSFTSPILLVGIDRFTSINKFEEIKMELINIVNKNNLTTLVGQIVFVNGSLLKEDEFKLNRKRLLKEYMNHTLSLYDVNKKEDNTDDELLNKVKTLFAVALNKDVASITGDLDFFIDGGGTSLDYYVISEAVQEEFHLSIFVDDKPLSTPHSIAKYIREHL